MSKFEKALDEKNSVDAATVADSSTPWKERIVNWMIEQETPTQTPEAIMLATDDKYDPESPETKHHFQARKHCLDSQITYIRQDYNIRVAVNSGTIALLGVVRKDKLVPFKNAVKLVNPAK